MGGKVIQPMLLTSRKQPFNDDKWIFELKYDGYRAVADLNGSDVRFYSRHGRSFLKAYPKIVQCLKALNTNATLDGELVVVDSSGKPSFQDLQNYTKTSKQLLMYYVFDCLQLNGVDLRYKPLLERKRILHQVISGAKTSQIRFCDHVVSDGEVLFHEVSRLGLEGIVGKRSDSIYLEGRRSNSWLKIKNTQLADFVVIGYGIDRGGKYFNNLILGEENGAGKIRYAGSVGTGFRPRDIRSIFSLLEPLKATRSPHEPSINLKETIAWVAPKLICKVKFQEITRAGLLRHPSVVNIRVKEGSILPLP